MKRLALLLMPILAAAPLEARDAIGVYGSWGAFTDAAPPRCFAIARPAQSGGASRWLPFASIATWPASGVRNQLHIRLSRAPAAGAGITLSIGERRFDLIGRNAEAWAPDARSDAAIVAAMRSARSMSVEAVAATGQPFADVYALHGAATAIDAASLACLGKG